MQYKFVIKGLQFVRWG